MLSELPLDLQREIIESLDNNGRLVLRATTRSLRDAVDSLPITYSLKKVVSHFDTTYYLDSSGAIFGCGDNKQGQLGLDHTDNRSVPTAINPDCFEGQPVTQIIANGSTTFFQLADGRLFGCGKNSCGQLGLGDTNAPFQLQPVCISQPIPIVTLRNKLMAQGDIVNRDLNNHCFLPSMPKSVLESLRDIQHAFPKHPQFSEVALPEKALVDVVDSTTHKTHVNVDPLLFAAFDQTMARVGELHQRQKVHKQLLEHFRR